MRLEIEQGRPIESDETPSPTPVKRSATTLAALPSVGPLSRRDEVDQARALLLAAIELLTPRVRCRRCGHELKATRSQELGIGPECRRREAAVLAVVSR